MDILESNKNESINLFNVDLYVTLKYWFLEELISLGVYCRKFMHSRVAGIHTDFHVG